MTIYSASDLSQTRTIHHIAQRIHAGDVLIFPTETIYGVGCSALQEASILRVFTAKGRKPDQPPPVLIASDAQLQMLVERVPDSAQVLIQQYWPGALTLILPARPDLPAPLCGWNKATSTRTVGVRMTGHATSRALCESSAPLIATSANFSGATGRAAAPQTLDDIPASFQQQADIIIDGGAVGGVPSTVIDCTGETPRVLRPGAVRIDRE